MTVPGRRYLVGGAVRDALLGRPAGDRDWVVVGTTAELMLAAGFTAVGRDFPVFLHPQTHEEHALARTERKQGHGYRGFVVHADPSVTLDDDLQRRDFTINAIAQADDGALVDPYGGIADLRARVLRHVAPAFVEDPLRLLRAARFLARFAPLGFHLADDTRDLLRQMVEQGEVDHLVPERSWQELHKALGEAQPSAMLRCLREVGALRVLLPEVDALYGVEQRVEFHPEIDAGLHTEMVLDQCARLSPGNSLLAFCGLTHDLGKALTPIDVRPKHPGHEHSGLRPLRTLCERFKVPREFADQAAVCCREHLNIHRLDELRDATVLELIERSDGLRRPQRIRVLGMLCEADKRGRLGQQDEPYPPRAQLDALLDAILTVQARDLDLPANLDGPEIGRRLRIARTAAITTARKAFATDAG